MDKPKFVYVSYVSELKTLLETGKAPSQERPAVSDTPDRH